MSVSIRDSIRINVVLASAAAEVFSFGTLMGAHTHTVTSNRFDGPYTQLADVVAAGFTSTAAPNVHAWASSVFAQSPRAESVFIGRIVAGDASLTASLDDILAEAGEDAWYYTTIESRVEADIMLAAAWMATQQKVLLVQTSDVLVAQVSQVVYAGVASSGVSSVHTLRVVHGTDVDITISYTSAGAQTSAQIATALFTAWNANAPAFALAAATNATPGTVVLTFLTEGVNYTVTGTHPTGTATPSTTTPATGDIFDRLNVAGYTRTWAVWHAFDDAAEGLATGLSAADGYLDAAWIARVGGFNLDAPQGAGTARYKRLEGITPDLLTRPEVLAIFAAKGNVYARLKSLSFPQKGTMASGRRVDVTTSLDWYKVRSEEELLGLFVGAPTKIPFTEAGINQIRQTTQGVLDRGVSFGHIAPDTPDTPILITMPRLSAISAADKSAGILTYTVKFTLAGSLEEVEIEVTVEE